MNNKKIGKETDEEVLIQTALSKYGRRAYDTSIAEGHCDFCPSRKQHPFGRFKWDQKKIATVKQLRHKLPNRKFS